MNVFGYNRYILPDSLDFSLKSNYTNYRIELSYKKLSQGYICMRQVTI